MLEGRDVSGAGEALAAPGLWVKRYGTRALTATVQEWVEFPKSVRGCGLPLGPTVGVHYSPRRPVIRGLRQCRNRFVCPDCSWYFRVVLEARWRAILGELVYSSYAPGFVVLSVADTPGEPLGTVVDDLMAAWQRFRSLDGHAGYRAGTDSYAWALDVTVGDAPGRYYPRLHCFTCARSVPADVDTEIERTAARWRRAVAATSGRSVPTGGFIFDYLTPDWLWLGVVAYALGIPYSHPGARLRREAVESRFGGPHTSRSSLLQLALRAHLHNDRKAGRLLADTAVGLTHRPSHRDSKGWKRVATAHAVDIDTDTDTVFSLGRHAEPQPFCSIGSGDYLAHKAVIDRWCDITTDLDLADMRASLGALLDDCGIEPIRWD